MVHIGGTVPARATGTAAGIGARPYVELTFDAQGDAGPGAREAVFGIEATDLLVFAHGWNSDRSTAIRLFDRFYAPFADLVGTGVRLGYVGVVWPSIRFSDEPIPDFDARGAVEGAVVGAAEPGHGTALDPATRRSLGAFWPGRAAELDRIAELLEERPTREGDFTEFGALVRELAGVDGVGTGDDLAAAFAPREVPDFLSGDVLRVCREFTDALAEAGATFPGGGAGAGGSPAPRPVPRPTPPPASRRAAACGRCGTAPRRCCGRPRTTR